MASPGQPPHSLPVQLADSSSKPSSSNLNTPPQSSKRIPDNTPPNHGTASIAEYQFDTTIDGIKENIAEDLRKAEECEIEIMLQAMMRIVARKTDDSTENQRWAETALQKCLDAAGNFLEQADNVYTKDLRCDATSEGNRYTGTASALNAAICHFSSNSNQQALPVELRVPEKDLTAIFQVNDPRIIKPDPPRASNTRKPDVIQLDWKKARILNGDEHAYDSFEDTVLLAHIKPDLKSKERSESNLRWSDVLMAFELKKKKSLHDKVIPTVFERQRLTSQNTFSSLKSPRSGFEVETSNAPSSENVTSTKLKKKASVTLPRKVSTPPLRTTRSFSTSPITMSSFPTTASTSQITPVSNSSSSFATESSPGASSAVTGLPYSSGSRKRKLDQAASGSSDQKRGRTAAHALHPAVQAAIYAAERLSTGAWIKCAVGIILLDDVLYLTMYDRQSPLAARGFDFLKNLPHFVVLAVILQRLQSCSWDTIAFPPTSEPQFTLKEQMVAIEVDGRKFQFNTADAATLYVLNGRGTTGVSVTEIGAPETKDRLFLKMSWPETVRRRESEIIEKIREVGQEHPLVIDHTPNLLAFANLTNHSTSNIRALLNLNRTDKDCSRILCCAVFERLSPITELEGMEFWKAYWEIVTVHYILWKKGIEHCDISISNMMFKRKNGTLFGILNDFDLARLRNSSGKREENHAHDRTGTIPFMAIDLLSPEAGEGLVHHQYRHDLESFAWVLFWMVSCFDGKKEVARIPGLKDGHISAESAYHQKTTFLLQVNLQPQQSWEVISGAAMLIQRFWLDVYYRSKMKIKPWAQNATFETDENDQDSSLAEEKGTDMQQLLPELLSFLASSHEGKRLRKEVLQYVPLNPPYLSP